LIVEEKNIMQTLIDTCRSTTILIVLFQIEIDVYKWKNLPGRLFWGGSKALGGSALPQIGKIRLGSCAGEVDFPPSC